jgi:hypothetical protein
VCDWSVAGRSRGLGSTGAPNRRLECSTGARTRPEAPRARGSSCSADKAHVGDVVKLAQAFHDHVADLRRGALPGRWGVQGRLDVIDDGGISAELMGNLTGAADADEDFSRENSSRRPSLLTTVRARSARAHAGSEAPAAFGREAFAAAGCRRRPHAVGDLIVFVAAAVGAFHDGLSAGRLVAFRLSGKGGRFGGRAWGESRVRRSQRRRRRRSDGRPSRCCHSACNAVAPERRGEV